MPGPTLANPEFTPVNQPVPQTQIPPDLLAALLPSPSVTGAIPSAQQQQLALELMQSGKIFGLQGQQDFGNLTMSTLGGAPAFNPFARMPAANPFISNLPPEIQGLFDFAPMSFQSQPFVSQDVYPGQQIGNLVSRADAERTRLQGLSNEALGLPKKAKDEERNQAIVDILNQWGASQGWEGNINDQLSYFAGNFANQNKHPRRQPGSGDYQLEGPTSPPGQPQPIADRPDVLNRPGMDTQGRTAEQAQGDLAPSDRLTPPDLGDQSWAWLAAAAPYLAAGVSAGAGIAGSVVQSNAAKKAGKNMGKIPGVFREPIGLAADQMTQELQRPSSTYMMPQVAPMSSFEIAGLGQIANQALNPQYQAAPITRAPTIRPLTGG